MKPSRFLFGVLLVQGLAVAQQTALFPAEYATKEGESYVSNYPFSGGINRYQTIYSKDYAGLANGAAITAIGVRPDGAVASTGHRVQLEIWMGHTSKWGTTSTNRLTGTFDSNYDGSLTRVYDKKTLTLPNLTPPVTPPSTSYVMVPLDRSFTYDRTRNLVVEYRVFANDNANQGFGYYIDAGGGYSTNTTFGQACQTSNNRTPQHTTSGPVIGGSSWLLSMTQGAASSAAAFFMGISNTSSFGLPLPFDLGIIGAPSCFLNVELRLTVPVSTDSGGNLGIYVTPPNDLQLFGSTVYTQVAMIDLFANNLGIITSNGAGTKVGALPQAYVVYATGDANAMSGGLSGGYGAVTVFQHQ